MSRALRRASNARRGCRRLPAAPAATTSPKVVGQASALGAATVNSLLRVDGVPPLGLARLGLDSSRRVRPGPGSFAHALQVGSV